MGNQQSGSVGAKSMQKLRSNVKKARSKKKLSKKAIVDEVQRNEDGVEGEEEEEEEEEEEVEELDWKLSEEERSMHNHRARIVQEMESSEQVYVSSLLCLYEVFAQPMGETEALGIPKATVRKLFCNIDQLVVVHLRLLHDIRKRLHAWQTKPFTTCVGDIFVRCSPALKSYTEYVNGYNDALMVVQQYEKNALFRSFITKTQENPRCRGLDLLSFLIMPVQRLPRYVMLLMDLLKHTPEV